MVFVRTRTEDPARRVANTHCIRKTTGGLDSESDMSKDSIANPLKDP